MQKAYFNWSSGKDSALALYHTQQSGQYDVQTLFTIIQKSEAKIAMHEISLDLLQQQAAALAIPLTVLSFDFTAPRAAYQVAMQHQMDQFKAAQIQTGLYGDLYLEDLRQYRIARSQQAGMHAVFPLWHHDPKALLQEFITLGFKSIVTCVDGAVLDQSFVGRIIDETFIQDLPPNVDVCGENGEYHSFVFDGPNFQHPVPFQINDRYYKDYPEPNQTRQHRYWYVKLE